MNSNFNELQSTESTNNYAIGQIKNGLADNGSAWFAHEQTAGKGQRGKQWVSAPGENIILSIAIDTSAIPLKDQFQFNAAIALTCYEFFKKYASDEIAIKWPNDIYWRDRKAAGILIENIIQGSIWKWAVVGIGININQTEFKGTGKKAISLAEITGKKYDVIELAKELHELILTAADNLKNTEGDINEKYNDVLYKKNAWQQFMKQNTLIIGKIVGVNDSGELVLQKDETIETFRTGELEWIFK